jgi:hypothetical protein
VSFNISTEAIALALGKTVEVLYYVQRDADPLDSDILTLTVRPLPSSALEAPKITQAPDDQNLDVGKLTGDADLTVKAWPFIATGQRIWLRFEGTQNDGTPYNWNHPTWQNFAITSAANQTAKVALNELQKLKSGSDLRLILEVSFDGGQTRTSFPVRTLQLAAAGPVTGYESWEAMQLQTLPLNQSIDCANGLKLTVVGSAASIVNVNTTYPVFGDRALRTAATCKLQFDFGGLVTRFYVSHVGADVSSNVLKFHDAQDSEIQRISLSSRTEIKSEQFTLSRACTYCILELTNNPNGVVIDNLIWQP